MRNRIQEIESIKAKGFNMVQSEDIPNGEDIFNHVPTDFSKIKLGRQNYKDASIAIGDYKRVDSRLGDKNHVLKTIKDYDLAGMREISDFYYKTNGIYNRMLRYMAFMYRYDWYVTPYINDESMKENKILDGFYKCLNTLDNFGVKKQLGEIALKVLRQGAYYGYKIETVNNIILQELPVDYCRSRFFSGNKPIVEFNMRYFETNFRDTEIRNRILKMFPEEFEKGYRLYKQGKLPPLFPGDTAGWWPLDVANTVKFNANGEDYPMFISVIPLIIDLDQAQDLDRQKTMQRLLKIVIQKMPLDKNGDLIFDVEEASQLHNNAVRMLSDAIGVDVLTTFADVTVEDLADSNLSSAQSDDLERVERQLFNAAGMSEMLFNTDGNIALEKSQLNDEASLYNLLLQFEQFLNDIIEKFNKSPKKVSYRVQLLTTTIYNYKELSKMYKEQMQLGFSKMLPQIALGQTQSSILANAYFENDVLDLVNVFIPPLMSSTMNADVLNRKQNAAGSSEGAGRPEKSDDEKSTKTIQNKESQS